MKVLHSMTHRSGLSFFLLLFLPATLSFAQNPSWWTNRNVLTTNTTNDYAAVNAGQVKWFATNAYAQMEAALPGGAGTAVANVITNFSQTNNYNGVNIGQLKNLAEPFYDRLIEAEYTNSYLWTTTTTDDVDYAAANIGQVKNLFSFDIDDTDADGLADYIETGTSNYVSQYNTGSSSTTNDTDDDGINDGTEVTNRTDPNNNDTTAPTVTITFPTNNYNYTWSWIP